VIEEMDLEPKNIHILYCGDLDPSGENIDWYIKKRLKQLGIEGVEFRRVAIRPEQIEKYNLPTLIAEKDPDKKAPDPNMVEFIRRFGNKTCHLNAFFTKDHFNTFKEILRDAVDDYWDEDIYQEMVDEYDVAADEPEEMDEEELLEARCDMCKAITEAFAPGWPKRMEQQEYRGLDDGSEDEEEDEDNNVDPE
jgi:hypothetical protein